MTDFLLSNATGSNADAVAYPNSVLVGCRWELISTTETDHEQRLQKKTPRVCLLTKVS